jgi:hypothetical protein
MSRAIFLLTLAAPLIALSVAACTAEQVYDSAQGWQRNQCNKDLDKTEYDRCMAQLNTPYDSYRHQTELEPKR